MRWQYIILLLIGLILTGCKDKPLNDPHIHSASENIYHSSFSSPPKTLDPAKAYSSDEIQFIAQIYEPPLQYHYLLRPYSLIPLTAAATPRVTYLDAQGHLLPEDAPAKEIAYSVYHIKIKPGIYYQPHPAFAKNKEGEYLYHHLSEDEIEARRSLADFPEAGTRELTADDYVYEIKRLASPKSLSPIFGFMENYIVGFGDYAKTLEKAYDQQRAQNQSDFLDLRQYPLPSVKAIDRYTYEIKIKGQYPQFQYWLAMPFFAPVPWEADAFYSQRGMSEHNLTFDWYPVGTGPYMLVENNPNLQMVLERNPHFHGEIYPLEGEPGDADYLIDQGQSLPMIDKFIFSLEKESIPRWNKFLQGYYDQSSVTADSFDQAIRIDEEGNPVLTDFLKAKGMRLQTTIEPSIYYFGFNMLDTVVGGDTERARKLRQAIALALDYEEYIDIFLNGRGIVAHGPVPPGIFGYVPGADGVNPALFEWDGKPIRKPIEAAKKLLAEAGYPGGRDQKTGNPVVLAYDAILTGDPGQKAYFDWMRKQFAKLGIHLQVRATQYNRFQEKVRTGNVQLFSWGWNADYPDPENFLFLLYGPNGKVRHGGENASNYDNPEYDALFEEMRNMPNTHERQETIEKMYRILWRDMPVVWGFHPKAFTLSHSWVRMNKPHSIANNLLKYYRIDPEKRARLQAEWNPTITWPVWLFLGLVIVVLLPVVVGYIRRERKREG